METSLLNDKLALHLQCFRLLLKPQACLRAAVCVSPCLSGCLLAFLAAMRSLSGPAAQRQYSNGRQGRAGACDSCVFFALQIGRGFTCDAMHTWLLLHVLDQRVFVRPAAAAAASHP